MSDQDKVVQFLRMNGPSLPAKVAKALDTQILFASAILSDLSSQGKVKISYLKVGGSPLYYMPGQEERLYQFAAGNMNPKDLQVLHTLKEQEVLREANLELLGKVALRSLQDFATPLHVTVNGQKELFWKWHLLSMGETNNRVREILAGRKGGTPLQEEVKETVPGGQSVLPQIPLPVTAEKQASEPVLPLITLVPELPQERTTPKAREKPQRKKSDEFFPVLESYFRKLSIGIEQKETGRKNAEMQFLLKVPSAVGKMTYFCKAKNKGKCDEKDLSAAYMEAQIKKLPLLFLYTGTLSKKAQEMLESGAFENVMVRKVG